jgi:hypothetical protein
MAFRWLSREKANIRDFLFQAPAGGEAVHDVYNRRTINAETSGSPKRIATSKPSATMSPRRSLAINSKRNEGWACKNAPRRGARISRAKVGSTFTRSCPRATPEMFFAPSATSSNWAKRGRASSQNAFHRPSGARFLKCAQKSECSAALPVVEWPG